MEINKYWNKIILNSIYIPYIGNIFILYNKKKAGKITKNAMDKMKEIKIKIKSL